MKKRTKGIFWTGCVVLIILPLVTQFSEVYVLHTFPHLLARTKAVPNLQCSILGGNRTTISHELASPYLQSVSTVRWDDFSLVYLIHLKLVFERHAANPWNKFPIPRKALVNTITGSMVPQKENSRLKEKSCSICHELFVQLLSNSLVASRRSKLNSTRNALVLGPHNLVFVLMYSFGIDSNRS